MRVQATIIARPARFSEVMARNALVIRRPFLVSRPAAREADPAPIRPAFELHSNFNDVCVCRCILNGAPRHLIY